MTHLPRTLEPEVMDTPEEALDYDGMDHSDVNRRFVDDCLAALAATPLAERVGSPQHALRILDVGTGTALIPIEFCSRPGTAHITAIDLAAEMLRLAETNIDAAGCAARIELRHCDGKQLPFADGEFDAVFSNSIIHHIPVPIDALREMVRVLSPDGLLFVRDLMRPETAERVEEFVRQYAGNENAHPQQMFRQSLHAALTLEEVRALLEELRLPGDWARATSDRHWTIIGVRSR